MLLKAYDPTGKVFLIELQSPVFLVLIETRLRKPHFSEEESRDLIPELIEISYLVNLLRLLTKITKYR